MRIWARLRLIMLLMMVTNREISDIGVDQFTTLLSLLCFVFDLTDLVVF